MTVYRHLARTELITVATVMATTVWEEMPCSLEICTDVSEKPPTSIIRVDDDAGSRFLWNVGIYLSDYTASHLYRGMFIQQTQTAVLLITTCPNLIVTVSSKRTLNV